MPRKIYINKGLLSKIQNGEETSDVTIIDIDEGMFFMDKTEGCIELLPASST